MKKYLSFMKHSLIVSVVFSLFVLGGCSDDDEKKPDPPYEGTVWQLITSDEFKQSEGAPATEALDSLVKYLELYNLDGLFQGATEYTLFAPSNQAFVNLLTTTPGFPSDITTISPNVVAGVLAYHAVPGITLKKDLVAGAEFATLFEQPDYCDPGADGVIQIIEVNANGTLLTGSTNAEIEIVSADNETTENGVVHITESVMIPPSVGATLTPILTTLAATVLLSADFEIVAGLITYADCGIVDATTPLVNILANPAGTMTAFLPPDDVFALGGLGDDITEVLTSLAGLGVDTPAEVRGVILNHIHVGGILEAADVAAAAGTNLTMASGNSFAITAGPPLSIGGKPIVVPDADTRNNGVAHAIAGILGF